MYKNPMAKPWLNIQHSTKVIHHLHNVFPLKWSNTFDDCFIILLSQNVVQILDHFKYLPQI